MRDEVNCGLKSCEWYDEAFVQCCRGTDYRGDPRTATCGRYRPKMRVVLFTDRMAALVAAGEKWQTVRRQARCRPGDLLSLRRWTGKPYRSKQEVLKEVVCSAVRPVRIGEGVDDVRVGGMEDEFFSAERFARRDGFEGFMEMRIWFSRRYGLPFCGEVMEWERPYSIL